MTFGESVWFGSLTPPSSRGRALPPHLWTWVGGLAIPLWATWPALALETGEVPPLECLTMAFAVAALVLSRVEPRDVEASAETFSWRRWIPALAFAVGSSGSAVFFLLATHYIAAARANLILYLWPIMVVALGSALGVFRLGLRHALGIALGFTGAAILMGGGNSSLSYVGIALALLGGVSWALYCVFRLTWRGPAGPLLAPGYAIAAVLCGALHVTLEPFAVPSIRSAAAMGIIGIVPAGFANFAWDQGFRRGDARLLAVMAYATPLCSTLLLALLGLESLTGAVLIGAVCIGVAGLLSRANA